MRINTKGYFDITMPRKALKYIYIDTALCAPCNKRVPQIMQFMSGAKPLKSTAYGINLFLALIDAGTFSVFSTIREL